MRKRSPLLATIILGFGPGLSGQASSQPRSEVDWPQFRGPGGLASSSTAKPPLTWSAEENLAWKVELPGPGTSSPIVAGGRIYLTCFTGFGAGKGEGQKIEDLKRHVLCLDLANGKTVWIKDVAPKLPEQERIRENHGYASSTPAVDRERLYVFFGTAGVFAFDLKGEQLWQADVGSTINGWGSAASPVVWKDLVFVNASVESESLVALNKKTGKEVWRARDIKDAWNTPLLVETKDKKTELVLAVMQQVRGFDPERGESLWTCDTGINWYMCPSLVAHEGIVYSTGGRGGGGSLAVRTGGRGNVTESHRLWRLGKGTNVPSPVIHEGHLYSASDSLSILYCQNAATGEIVYEERLEPSPGQFYASPVLAAGRLYYVSRDGRTVVVAAKPKYELLAQNSLKDRSTFNASPAIAGDRLLLRSDRFLYCIAEQ